ncbi:GNAT family N-acetyltransferase [Polynucleobacter paneuropaeus]|nr:GNAT family N-acetyltransferase [Polynucleobacter paneuropaeus]
MKISIKSLEKIDMPQVISLLKKNLSNFSPSISEYDDIWSRYSTQENVYSVVALLGDAIVGYGTVVIEEKIRGGAIAHIEDICTSSDFRHCGVGSSIMDKLLEIAKQHKCYKLVLSCKKDNLGFYSHNGYKQDGISMSQFILNI